MRSLIAVAGILVAAAGCGASAPTSRTSGARVVQMDELRIQARRKADGTYEFGSYDAQSLFHRAFADAKSGRCASAVVLYDRIADEFPQSQYASPSMYNAGLCLKETGQVLPAIARFERLLRQWPSSPDVKHGSFQLADLYVSASRWDDAIRLADALLAREDLVSDERVEAMARRAQALLGASRLEQAESQARSALTFYRTRPDAERVRESYFAAAANFVLAETFRLRAEAIDIPPGAVGEQREVLERRARLVLDGQREYFNTISLTDPHWGAASGYRIGMMYDAFWSAIMGAPVPPPRKPMTADEQRAYATEYRVELARLIKPLIRHSIRYWELTLMMIERTGVKTDWAAKIRIDLDRARTRLLEAPADAAPKVGPNP